MKKYTNLDTQVIVSIAGLKSKDGKIYKKGENKLLTLGDGDKKNVVVLFTTRTKFNGEEQSVWHSASMRMSDVVKANDNGVDLSKNVFGNVHLRISDVYDTETHETVVYKQIVDVNPYDKATKAYAKGCVIGLFGPATKASLGVAGSQKKSDENDDDLPFGNVSTSTTKAEDDVWNNVVTNDEYQVSDDDLPF